MSCFKTSSASFKYLLRKKGLIDEYLNVLDLGRFRSEVTQWSNYAYDKYGITERLFFDEQNGTKAVPNERAFQIIDYKKGVKYPDNEWVGKDLTIYEADISEQGKVTNLNFKADVKSILQNGTNTGRDILESLVRSKRVLWFGQNQSTGVSLGKYIQELKKGNSHKQFLFDLEGITSTSDSLSRTFREEFNSNGNSLALGLGVIERLLQDKDNFIGRVYANLKGKGLDGTVGLENEPSRSVLYFDGKRIMINLAKINILSNRFDTYEDFVNGIDLLLSEELIHAITQVKVSDSKIDQLYEELTPKEIEEIKRIYTFKSETPLEQRRSIVYEYLRMIVQDNMFGTITEGEFKRSVFNIFREVLNYLQSIFKQNTEREIPQVVKAIEDFIYSKNSQHNNLYQQREYSPNQITPEVKEQLLGFLRNVNPDFRVEVIDNLSSNGIANIPEFLISLKRGKENLALSEETSHVFLELLTDNQLRKDILGDVVRTKMYKWVIEEYGELYEMNYEKLKREAAAKLISLYIQDREAFNYWSGSNELNSNLGRLITRLINWIKKHFKNPYSKAATQILQGSTAGIDTSLAMQGEVYHQLDSRYSEFETLDVNDITKFDKIFINLNNTLLDYKGYVAPEFPMTDRTIIGKNVKRLFFSDAKLRGELDRYYRDANLTKLGRELKDKMNSINPNRIVVFTDAPISDALITRLEQEFGPINIVRTGYNIQETLFDEFGNPVDRIVSGSEKEAYIRNVVLDNPRSNILFVDNQSSPLQQENIPNLQLRLYSNDSATYTDVQTKINQELISQRNKEFSEGVIKEMNDMDRNNLAQLARQSMNMVKNHIRKIEEGKGLDELSEIFKDEDGNVNIPFAQGNLVRLLEDIDNWEQGLLGFVNTIESTRLFFKKANDNDFKGRNEDSMGIRELLAEDTPDSNDKALREIAVLMRMILSWEQWIEEVQRVVNKTQIVNGVLSDLRQELVKANTTLNEMAVEVLSRQLSEQWKDFNLGKKKLLEQRIITKEVYDNSIYTAQKLADWLYGKYGDARTDSSHFENPLMQSEPIIQAISRRLELSMLGGEQKNLDRIVPFQQRLWDLGKQLNMSDEEIGKRITVEEQENYWEDGVMKQRPTLFLLNQWQGTWMRKAKENEVKILRDKWLEVKNQGLDAENEELIYRKAQEDLNLWIQENWYDEVTPEGKNVYREFGIEDSIFELAKERQKEIYEQMQEQTSILRRFWISEEMENNANAEMERLVRELRLLRNEFDEQGNLKEGDDLLIARKLKEKSLIDRQIYDYQLDKPKFLDAIKEQILSIADEDTRTILLSLLNPENLHDLYQFAKDNAPQVFVDWLDRNTRVRYSDNFYQERGEIIERIKEITGETQLTQQLDEIWKELTNLTSFLRDKDLTFDATDSNPIIQQRVKDYELALEDLKSEGETNPEIIPLIQRLSEIQSKRYSDYYKDVMYDKLKDLLPISSTTNCLELINSPDFRQWFTTAPQEFKDWFNRNHYSKQMWDDFTQSKQPRTVPTYIWMKIEPADSKDILVVPGWKYNTRELKESAEVEFNGETKFIQLKTPQIDWTTWNPVERVWLPKSSQFRNPEYDRLKNSKDEKDKLLFEYLQTVTQFHLGTQDRENGVSRDSVLGFKIPYFHRKYTEGGALSRAWKSASDTLNPREEGEGSPNIEKKKGVWKRLLSFSGINSEQQEEKIIRTDYLGNQFKTIYTPYTTYLTPEETTKNLPLSISNYSAGVEKVKALKNDLPQLNLLEQVFEQFLPKQKGTKNQYGEMVDASTNNRLKLLRHVIDTKLYSDFKDFELGRGIDKFLVGVRKTAVIGSQSDLNIPNAFKNFLQGQLMNWLFIEDGGWGTRKTFYKAARSTKTSYANFVYEMGKQNKSIDYHILAWFNPLLTNQTQDYSREARGNELQDRIGYFSSTASEFGVSATLLYSHLFSQDVMINGEKKKLYDAFTTINGVLAIKPNTTIEGQPLTLEYLQDLKLRFKMMLESVQGKQWNQTLAQRFTVWQSIEFFKKFFITMFRRRFFFKRDNIVLGEMEGMYITTFKWMVRLFQGFLDGTNYNQAMTPAEKRNLVAARDEMLLAIATLFIITYLFGFDDDDKDKYKKLKDNSWLENMALLIAINTKRETDSLVPLPFITIQNSIYPPVLNETYNFITSPFVGFTVIQEGRKMLDSLLMLATGDDKAYYDRNMPAYLIEEGDSKFEHYLWKVIQLDNFLYQQSPEAKIQVIVQSQNR